MGNYTILKMFENPRRGRQARNFTTNVAKILVLKSSSEQIFSRKLPLGAPESAILNEQLNRQRDFSPLFDKLLLRVKKHTRKIGQSRNCSKYTDNNTTYTQPRC